MCPFQLAACGFAFDILVVRHPWLWFFGAADPVAGWERRFPAYTWEILF